MTIKHIVIYFLLFALSFLIGRCYLLNKDYKELMKEHKRVDSVSKNNSKKSSNFKTWRVIKEPVGKYMVVIEYKDDLRGLDISKLDYYRAKNLEKDYNKIKIEKKLKELNKEKIKLEESLKVIK